MAYLAMGTISEYLMSLKYLQRGITESCVFADKKVERILED